MSEGIKVLLLGVVLISVPVTTGLWLQSCQESTASQVVELNTDPPGDQLTQPYEDCLCNETHALNEKIDKLLKMLECICAKEE